MMTGNSRIKLLAACLVALFVISLFQTPASTQSPFLINTTSDTADNNIGDGICADVDGNCSLRAAIQESNSLPGFPPEEIILPTGTYFLTMGQLTIQNSLFLTGDGPASTIIDGSDLSRIFQIEGTNSPIVNISGVTIQNGKGGTSLPGGGILLNQGSSASFINVVVRENETRAPGGGIANAGFLQIVESTIQGNKVPLDVGGGVQFSAGGIMNFLNGTLKIDRSTINDNEATRGGGIRNGGGHMEITNSTVSGNRANTRGGGIMNHGTVFIAFSTITNNTANLIIGGAAEPSFGGGVYNTGSVSIGNTILAGNTDNRSRFDPNYSPDCFSGSAPGTTDPASFTSFRGNLVGILTPNCDMRDTIYGDTRFDLVGTPEAPLDAKLDPLADNGGPTWTHALQLGSPAIDNGTGVTSATFFDCPGTDQRGVPRPQGAACDIGAYELETQADLSISKTDSPDPVNAGSNLTYTLTITNNGPNDATGVIIADTLPAEVTLASATPSQGSCSSSVTCDLGNLASGASATIMIVVTVDPATPSGTITNTATVTGNETDPNTADNTVTEDTVIQILVLPIDIDIWPFLEKNIILLGRDRQTDHPIPVAILSTPTFDSPSRVDQTSLTFGRTGDEPSLDSCLAYFPDVNGDGLGDLVCVFQSQLTGFRPGDSEGILKGKTLDGASFEGQDSILVFRVERIRMFTTRLRGSNEVPTVDTDARGDATLTLERHETRLHFVVKILDIKDVTAIHIHCGSAGINGPIGVTLFSGGPVTKRVFQGDVAAPDAGNACGWSNLDAVVAAMLSGDTYINVHTTAHPDGEIRGQVNAILVSPR